MIPPWRDNRWFDDGDNLQAVIFAVLIVLVIFVALLIMSTLVTHGSGVEGIPTDDPVYATIAAEQTAAAWATAGNLTPSPSTAAWTPTPAATETVEPCMVRITTETDAVQLHWMIALAMSRIRYTSGPGFIEVPANEWIECR